ncbi:hypothetical protein EDB81DRAFT_810990 [Dactylonectria macrodidyma]|uniref:DUF7730 domain-containing protein n=1 Tax=Dactylonectria macrodidyma TaxID=307937 RepID=A0A9P9DT55_9HYPO|nr:hypothetical protein EDB81DRAFT_810990 [Dactylonectria macrodidyma]
MNDSSADPDPKEESLFFTRLPREIRLLIFEEVAHSTNHEFIQIVEHTTDKNIVVGKFRFAHVCSGVRNPFVGEAESGPKVGENDAISTYLAGVGCVKRPITGVGDLLRLLQTCRKMHYEVLPFLYGATPFHFKALHRLHAFTGQLTPDLRGEIQSLHIHLTWEDIPMFRVDPTEMVQGKMDLLSRELTSLVGLKHIRVVLSDPEPTGHGGWRVSLDKYLEPLRKVAQSREIVDFVVVLPPSVGEIRLSRDHFKWIKPDGKEAQVSEELFTHYYRDGSVPYPTL